MAGNISKDWPVYVLLAGMVFFFIYVIINGNIKSKEDEDKKGKEK